MTTEDGLLSVLAAALEHASRGLPVFPLYPLVEHGGKLICSCSAGPECGAPGKHPRIKNYAVNATTDPVQIQAWWRRWPRAGIAMPTGQRSGVVVIDIDGEVGETTMVGLELLSGKLPDTISVSTPRAGGGRHLWFRYDKHTAKLRCGANVLPGIDIRTTGGLVVLPPSPHKSGRCYEWEAEHSPNDCELAEMPNWLINELMGANGGTKHRSAPPLPDVIPTGMRNDMLMSLAGSMRHRNASESAILAALLAENQACSPPLPEDEVRRIAASAARYPAGRQEKFHVTEEELATARERIAQAKSARTAAAVFDVVEALSLLPPGEFADTIRELKEVVPQLDLRELKGAVTRSRKSQRAGETGVYAELVVSNRQLREVGYAAISLLERANVPPTLFVRSGALCQVVEDERGHPLIRSVTEDVLLSRLAKICDIVAETADGPKNVVPPKSIASYILAEGRWPFPALEAITRSPIIRRDGSISQLPGYDPATRLYYHRATEETMEVPDTPTRQEVENAVGLLDELLCDFPFDCQASRAHAHALLLSPLIQSTAADPTPLFLIDAPTAGSGKSLLALVAGIICTGVVPDFTTAPTKVEEWPKKITAILSAGPSLVVFDNLGYCLQSPELAMVITSRVWKERVFGTNTETAILPNRAVWVVTGNNIQLGGDIARRCVWIRIDPKQAKPHERDGFLHPNLTEWVLDNRGRLLSALLTLCRAWFADGSPAYPVPAFGSFEGWARTIGGILAHAGVAGFLGNRERLWEQSDTESGEWEAFLSAWVECYGCRAITPKELVRDIETGAQIADVVPTALSDAVVHGKGNSFSRVGYQLKARLGKRYGPRGLRLERGPQKSRGNTWLVLADTRDAVEGCNTTAHSNRIQTRSDEWTVDSCGGLHAPNAGAEDIISECAEIIPFDSGSDAENPPQPSTIHSWTNENYEDF